MLNIQNFDKNKTYNFNFPAPIRLGVNVCQELVKDLSEKGLQRPLWVSDSFLTGLNWFHQLKESFHLKNIYPIFFSDFAKNPVKQDVLRGVKTYIENGCDCIIGLGGGASIDVARAIALWVNHQNRDLFEFDDALDGYQWVTNPIPPFFTVPTTSGTGSEVGRSTVISDDITHEKKILFSPKLMALKVYLDPALTLDLPTNITAACGFDALTHNIEAYLAQGFNPLCEGIALQGIEMIFSSLETCYQNPKDIQARAQMQVASLMGAVAFQKGLGIVHSLAHPLSTVFDCHHGLANAIMLPFGLAFNQENGAAAKIERLSQFCSLSFPQNRQFNLIQHIQTLQQKLKIPENLKGLYNNASEQTLNRLADLAINDPCHQSNPVKVTRNNFLDLYKKAFGLSE